MRFDDFARPLWGLGLIVFVIPALAAPKLKPEDLIAKHLESLGPIAAVKSLKATGTCGIIPRVGGSGRIDGEASIASGDGKWALETSFENPQFPHEKISFDGDKADVSQIRPGIRSPLGNLLYTQDRPIAEGLFGGTLSTRWALLAVKELNPKLKYRGLKKIDDRQLHILEYNPRKGTDLKIRLYFEPESFHHVRTDYRMTISAASVKLSADSTQAPESHYEAVEEFSDFRTEGGVTLPHAYTIHYSSTGQSTLILDYEMVFEQFWIE